MVIFGWPGKPSIIFVKWFPFFKILNHFPNLIFSFHMHSLAIHFPLQLEVARDPRDPPPAIAIRLPRISPAATTGGHRNPLLVFASGCRKLLSEVVCCCLFSVRAKCRKMFSAEIIFLKMISPKVFFNKKTFYLETNGALVEPLMLGFNTWSIDNVQA